MSAEIIPISDKERELARELKDLDDALWEQDKELDDVSEQFESLVSRLCGVFVEWCEQKGAPKETSYIFGWAVSKFTEYLYKYHGGGVTREPQKAVAEFMGYHYLRKHRDPLSEKSAMPAALKLFARFLKEKEIAPEFADALVSSVNECEDAFIENLKRYHSPQDYS